MARPPREPTLDAPFRAPSGSDPLLQTFGFLGGAAAWALHLTVGYGLVEIDCRSDLLAWQVAGVPGLHLLGFVLTLLAAATAVVAAVVAAGTHPRPSRDGLDPADAHETEARSRFLAYGGMLLSGLFTIAILAGGSSYFFLGTCP